MPIVVSVLASQVVVTDLAAPMLAEPVSQQSVKGLLGIRCGKQSLVLPLSSVLSVTMTQIVSTLASLLQGAWHPGHTPAFQSALYPLLTDDMFLLDLQQELVSLFAPDLASFLAVFSPLMQHCQQETASTKLVSSMLQSLLLSLSKLVDMDAKTSSGSRPVADLLVSSEHWLADPGWWGRGRQPLLPGPLPLPCPPPGEETGCGGPVPQGGDDG